MAPRIALILSIVAMLFGVTNFILLWQMRHDPRTYQSTPGYSADGSGMGCPMCGGPWQNPNGWNGTVPATLPQPKKREWTTKLQSILTQEKYSLAQYTADEEKYHVVMPYMMIIPQERNHITWISGLFAAYKLPADGAVRPVKQSASVVEAYQIAQKLEADLIPQYVWLITNAEDQTTRQVLDTILLQTRMHYTMFTHVLDMRNTGMWQQGYHNGQGHGMMGDRGGMMMGCPMCGGMWRNPNGWTGTIPQSLPQPTDQEWITRLRGILVSEKFSLAQYTADEDKYRVRMPYMMIIPQEQNHIAWINGLFAAYKLSADGTVPPVKKSASITEAYQIAQALEADLIPRYAWLIGHTNDPTTKQVLDTILLQSRMHYTMFTHALQMRGMGMPY